MTSPLLLPPSLRPRPLTEQTAQRTDDPTDLRMGTVVAVTAYGVTVNVGGGEVPASHLDSYSPAVGHTVVLQRVMDSWVCLGRPVGKGTAQDNSSPGSGMGMTVLGGVHFGGGANLATSVGAEVTVPGMSVSVFHPAGHALMIMVGHQWYSTNAADAILVRVKTTNGQIVGEWVMPITTASYGRFDSWATVAGPALGGFQRTYYVTMLRVGGTGTTTLNGTGQQRAYVVVADLGDKTLVRTGS